MVCWDQSSKPRFGSWLLRGWIGWTERAVGFSKISRVIRARFVGLLVMSPVNRWRLAGVWGMNRINWVKLSGFGECMNGVVVVLDSARWRLYQRAYLCRLFLLWNKSKEHLIIRRDYVEAMCAICFLNGDIFPLLKSMCDFFKSMCNFFKSMCGSGN